jgi:predicted transcriptional regulator
MTTTIKVSTTTRDRIKIISQRTHQSAEGVILDALDELDRKLFWDEYDAASSAIAVDPRSATEEIEDRKAWDATLTDGADV